MKPTVDSGRTRKVTAMSAGYGSRLLRVAVLPLVATLTIALAACATNTTENTAPSDTSAKPGTGGTAIGFIFVGPKDDYGYNQAAYEGSQEVAKAFPNLKVLTAENVPEDDNATRIMEGMIAQ